MSLARRLAVGTAAAAFATLAIAPATSATAAGVLPDKKPPCPKPHGRPYPPGICKKSQSASSIAPGHQVTIEADGYFFSNEPVDVTLHSQPVLLTTVNSSPDPNDSSAGDATATVTIPKNTAEGDHQLIMTGQKSGGTVSFDITVARLPHTGGSNLPFTGAAAAIPLTAAGAAMVISGGLVLMSVRRRRRPTSA